MAYIPKKIMNSIFDHCGKWRAGPSTGMPNYFRRCNYKAVCKTC